jgi:hypothetical protein
MLAILSIAHKYCMDKIEKAILDRLEQAYETDTYVDLMVASQIVDSKPLYRQALRGLISSAPKPNLLQARRIGIEAHHAIMEAALSMADNATSSATVTISSLNAAVTASNSALAAAKAELATLNSKSCRHCEEDILDSPPLQPFGVHTGFFGQSQPSSKRRK